MRARGTPSARVRERVIRRALLRPYKRKVRRTPAPQPVSPQDLKNQQRFNSSSEELVANVFQNVCSAFHAYFPAQDRILVLDAENAFVADVHVRLDDGLPS